tara:strand:- start:3130 stop:3480 length:351 start_codon:yes stop_codon:yes gene_type:complete
MLDFGMATPRIHQLVRFQTPQNITHVFSTNVAEFVTQGVRDRLNSRRFFGVEVHFFDGVPFFLLEREGQRAPVFRQVEGAVSCTQVSNVPSPSRAFGASREVLDGLHDPFVAHIHE